MAHRAGRTTLDINDRGRTPHQAVSHRDTASLPARRRCKAGTPREQGGAQPSHRRDHAPCHRLGHGSQAGRRWRDAGYEPVRGGSRRSQPLCQYPRRRSKIWLGRGGQRHTGSPPCRSRGIGRGHTDRVSRRCDRDARRTRHQGRSRRHRAALVFYQARGNGRGDAPVGRRAANGTRQPARQGTRRYRHTKDVRPRDLHRRTGHDRRGGQGQVLHRGRHRHDGSRRASRSKQRHGGGKGGTGISAHASHPSSPPGRRPQR